MLAFVTASSSSSRALPVSASRPALLVQPLTAASPTLALAASSTAVLGRRAWPIASMLGGICAFNMLRCQERQCRARAVNSRQSRRHLSIRRAEGRPRLYGSQGSRSPLVNWYLYEIGQDFEMIDAQQDRGPHPFGQIPCLTDNDLVIFESGAILMYLADKYGGLDTPEKRAEVGRWVVWSNATLDPICFKEIEGRVVGTGLADEPRQITRLNEILEGRDFIVGSEFSVADVAIGSYLLYVLLFFPNTNVAKWPNVRRYMKALCEREAYAKAFGPRTAKMLSEALAKEPQEQQGLFGMF